MMFIENMLETTNKDDSTPCKYTMSPIIKKKIDEMAKRDIKKVVEIYSRLLKLTGPQTLMVRMLLLQQPLENLEKQNINLVSMFMQNLANNLQPDI
jgi:hypothetical protein